MFMCICFFQAFYLTEIERLEIAYTLKSHGFDQSKNRTIKCHEIDYSVVDSNSHSIFATKEGHGAILIRVTQTGQYILIKLQPLPLL